MTDEIYDVPSLSGEDREMLQRNCRALRHAWEIGNAPPHFKKDGLFVLSSHVLHLRCISCGAIRSDGLNRYGGLVARRYQYPDGYLMDKAEERPSADDLRLWMYKKRKVLRGRR